MVVHQRDHIDCDDEKTRRLWQGWSEAEYVVDGGPWRCQVGKLSSQLIVGGDDDGDDDDDGDHDDAGYDDDVVVVVVSVAGIVVVVVVVVVAVVVVNDVVDFRVVVVSFMNRFRFAFEMKSKYYCCYFIFIFRLNWLLDWMNKFSEIM